MEEFTLNYYAKESGIELTINGDSAYITLSEAATFLLMVEVGRYNKAKELFEIWWQECNE